MKDNAPFALFGISQRAGGLNGATAKRLVGAFALLLLAMAVVAPKSLGAEAGLEPQLLPARPSWIPRAPVRSKAPSPMTATLLLKPR